MDEKLIMKTENKGIDFQTVISIAYKFIKDELIKLHQKQNELDGK